MKLTKKRKEMVKLISADMKEKLKKCMYKGDQWDKESYHSLFGDLSAELLELKEELFDKHGIDIEAAQQECVDVANYAAMIYDKLRYG